MTRDELVDALLSKFHGLPAVLVRPGDPAQVREIEDLVRRREEALLDQCRRALQAERDYLAAINQRVGSRYSAERRERFIEYARQRRDETAKELGL